MAKVLTSASTVKCGHGAGAVPASGSAALRVDGARALVEADVTSATIAGCTTPVSSGNKPCTKVKEISAGRASKLTANGKPVLLDALKGTTDGTVGGTTPQPLLSASAGQSRLTSA